MPGPRNLPARASQRKFTHQQEEPPVRTRSGRESKAAANAEKPDIVSPKASSSQSSITPITRKNKRAATSITNYANIDSSPEIYSTYEAPFFMVFGLSYEFFESLKHRKSLNFSKRPKFSDPNALSTPFINSDDEEESSEESDVPTSAHPAPRGRGRGGRGSRGGRGRGGRGRGARGGRGRGNSARTTSPLRTRPSRNAAPDFPLVDEDEEDLSNQDSPMEDAKDSREPEEEITTADEQSELKEERDSESEESEDVQLFRTPPSTTPPGSPPSELIQAYDDPSIQITVPIAIPKISLSEDSTSHTSRNNAARQVKPAIPNLLQPEDDVLSDVDLPGPWIEGLPTPIEEDCEDRADFLLQKLYNPLTDFQDIVSSLTKYPLSQRSTASLHALAANTQMILKAWQDQYLELDAKTAPHAHPPKKPCNGGRIPINQLVFEDMKEADLYGYTYDQKKPPGTQDPFVQRPGHEPSGGRELRTRRARDMLDSAAPSEEDEEEDEGRPTRRQRRATRPFEGSDQGTGSNTPKKNNGWGGARKKGVSKYAKQTASETPEPEVRGKRGRVGAGSLLHQRIHEMRELSAVTSSGDEGSSNANSAEMDENAHDKRGRSMGSKHVGRRSDYGIKKGPRKRVYEEEPAVPSAHAPNAPPPGLQSLSEGQGQFTVDTPVAATIAPPIVGTHSSETVFQATPQPPGDPDAGSLGRSAKAQTPDLYMNTTPLSQYSNSYVDESAGNSASGSRKKPRVKSEKRSQSMTIWWAERKARQKELEEKSGTPAKQSVSRSNSSTGRRGGRTSAVPSASRPPPEPQSRPSTSHQDQPPQEYYPIHYPPQPPPPSYSGSSPSHSYAAVSYPPPQPMTMQHSPLAAIPSGPPLASAPSSAPPSAPPNSGRALAPAPLPPQIPMSYPSPYGPRTAPRPKSNAPPPLAPAPSSHISPYPPMVTGPVQHKEMPFKVMIPGPPPPDQRRPSR